MDAFRRYGSIDPVADRAARFRVNRAFYDGTWYADPAVNRGLSRQPRVYQRTRLVWNLARSTTDLYTQGVYRGVLSTDGKPLPDGTGGAIPLDPQTGDDAKDEAIRRAVAELWSAWRWQQHMALATKFSAIYGSCLVELVDDLSRGIVEPRHVKPEYVADVELNSVGDIKRYAIEYRVETKAGTAYGRNVRAESFQFRKEVDKEAFRYFRDDRPSALPDWGIPNAVEPNPYGFVPAVWYRHEIVDDPFGPGAFESALQTERDINAILSLALDYQSKQFVAPVGYKGGLLRPDADGGKVPSADPWADAERAADTLKLLPLGDKGEFVTISFDVGQTVGMVGKLEERLLAEFPEAHMPQKLLEVSQLTGPGAERAMGPIVGRVKGVRDVQDPQTVKLLQMPLAMIGWRLGNGGYPAAIVSARKARYDAFRPFDLTSYGSGALDFGIADRPVIPETEMERIARLAAIEALQTPWALERAGVSEDDARRILAERREAGEDATTRFARAFNAGAGA